MQNAESYPYLPSENQKRSRSIINHSVQTSHCGTMGGQRPHVEIAAVIPDGQGKIIIGKRKGKTGTGMLVLQIDSRTLTKALRSSHVEKRSPDKCCITRTL